MPLGLNTVATLTVQAWSGRIEAAALVWLADTPNAQVLGADFTSNTATIDVLTPERCHLSRRFLDSLTGRVPAGVEIVIHRAESERTVAGTVP